MNLTKITRDTEYLQRILKFAGYDCGVIDGIRGQKTNRALENWLLEADKIKREIGTLDPRSEDNLQTLIPSVQKSVRQWMTERVLPWMKQNGTEVKLICGTRTINEQNELYAKGRTTAGAKVTNAKGGSSFHNYGIAFDIGIFRNGKYQTSDDLYIKLVNDCGCPEGMINGGSWKKFKDYPHYQVEKYGSKIANVKKVWLSL